MAACVMTATPNTTNPNSTTPREATPAAYPTLTAVRGRTTIGVDQSDVGGPEHFYAESNCQDMRSLTDGGGANVEHASDLNGPERA
jgi:hypothetical protein